MTDKTNAPCRCPPYPTPAGPYGLDHGCASTFVIPGSPAAVMGVRPISRCMTCNHPYHTGEVCGWPDATVCGICGERRSGGMHISAEFPVGNLPHVFTAKRAGP